MHILRVDWKNGLHVEFNFVNDGDARKAWDAIDTAKKTEEVLVQDDAGRQSKVLRGEVQHFMVVDFAAEVAAAVQAEHVKQAVVQKLAPQQQVVRAAPGLLVPPGTVMPSAPRGKHAM